jgi:hypothetical protein
MTDTWVQTLIIYEPIELACNDIEEGDHVMKKRCRMRGDMFRRTQKYLSYDGQPHQVIINANHAHQEYGKAV